MRIKLDRVQVSLLKTIIVKAVDLLSQDEVDIFEITKARFEEQLQDIRHALNQWSLDCAD